jgi:hypothetical protein
MVWPVLRSEEHQIQVLHLELVPLGPKMGFLYQRLVVLVRILASLLALGQQVVQQEILLQHLLLKH